MKTHLSDEELIEAIRERKQIGAEALYDQYAVILFKVICCKVQDAAITEAILEKTFLRTWTNIEAYQPQKGRLLLWMIGTIRGLADAAHALIIKQATEIDRVDDVPWNCHWQLN